MREEARGGDGGRRGGVLRVCVTCRWRGLEVLPGTELRPGQRLYDLVIGRLGGPSPAVQPICCLSNCFRACNAVLSGRGKAAIMMSEMAPEPDVAAQLVAAFRRYGASEDGGGVGDLPGTLHVLRPASGSGRRGR
ncbi:MAG: DUF1636 family protein [Alphaproteobacteria bacterium]